MVTLFLDTASAQHTLALCSDEQVLSQQLLETKGDATLIPAIESIVKKHNYTYEDLTHLACMVGPGGFTSLRVGITCINTLSYALGIPSTGMYLWDLWNARLPLKGDACHWLHSTKRTHLFAKSMHTDDEPTLLKTEDAMKLEGSYVGELIKEHATQLSHMTQRTDVMDLQDILPHFLSQQSYTQEQLLPWYGREG